MDVTDTLSLEKVMNTVMNTKVFQDSQEPEQKLFQKIFEAAKLELSENKASPPTAMEESRGSEETKNNDDTDQKNIEEYTPTGNIQPFVPHGINPAFVVWVDVNKSKHQLEEAAEIIADQIVSITDEQEKSTGVLRLKIMYVS